ncbi:FAD-dependent monooxygenase [Streptomyces sp. DSM 44917]|uniref:FAD-dependent monooxygenase n=1 Tax=Streptomyces boetiae TaxID=3075541 RepID=A0ABU2L546_9ACTN|nr:FAD-dependent monooxygenase [Streptomyces sp. DSM 44917]MDT0306692.1 FAD-dependent monooxygenase [Streptomyces sp. DSM 44917]
MGTHSDTAAEGGTRQQGPDDAYDVLVVGGGPTGMMLGCELLRRGIRVRIIDRAPEPSPFPKALLVWPRSMDLFQDLGILGELRKAGLDINAFSYFSDRQHLATFDFPEPLVPVCLPQNETERILRTRLAELGGTVERGVRLLTFDRMDYSGSIDRTDGVTAVLEHADGRIERAHAPFVAGTDGAGSAVRAQLGTGFSGSTYETAFALVDCHIDGELPVDQALYYQSPAGALVIVALPDNVFRFFCSLPPGESVSMEKMQRVVDERGPRGVRLKDPVWESVFRVHARHANDFQLGRVFIAGDAAHVHSPAGGQGLNTGLQDAHNLAWKLAAVIRGEAPSDLLLSYGPERSAVAKRVVRDTDIQTRAWMVKRPGEVVVRNAAFQLAERAGFARFYAPVMAGRRIAYPVVRDTQRPGGRTACRLLGRLPGRLQIGAVFPRELAVPHGIAGPDADPGRWTLAAVDRGPASSWRKALETVAGDYPQVRLTGLAAAPTRRLTGCAREGYYLIRPDGHIAAHGHLGDLPRLRKELTTVLGEPRPLANPAAGPSSTPEAGPLAA